MKFTVRDIMMLMAVVSAGYFAYNYYIAGDRERLG